MNNNIPSMRQIIFKQLAVCMLFYNAVILGLNIALFFITQNKTYFKYCLIIQGSLLIVLLILAKYLAYRTASPIRSIIDVFKLGLQKESFFANFLPKNLEAYLLQQEIEKILHTTRNNAASDLTFNKNENIVKYALEQICPYYILLLSNKDVFLMSAPMKRLLEIQTSQVYSLNWKDITPKTENYITLKNILNLVENEQKQTVLNFEGMPLSFNCSHILLNNSQGEFLGHLIMLNQTQQK